MIEALAYLQLFGGLVYLLLGGDLLVRGAIALSARSKIPTALVGLTIVALGTSAPELVISLHAALNGFSALAIGNVVGSNIANVLMVLGVPILLYPTHADERGVSRHTGFMVAITLGFIGLCFLGPLTSIHGGALLALLIAGGILALRGQSILPGLDTDGASEELERVLGLPHRPLMIATFLLVGAIALPLGADLTVDGGVAIAVNLGVSQAVIGSSLVAFGTSLPELTTTIMAALHRSAGVALGNVIGSNVLNILAIMGLTALIVPVPVPEQFLRFDLWVMLGAALVLWVYVLRGATMGRTSGVVFVLAYVAYLVTIYRL